MPSRRCPRNWSIQQRLDRYSIRDPETGCILWTGCRDTNGYGKLKVGGRLWTPHRASWTAANGPIPQGLLVCHKCDVRTCINPHHLFLGTNADNMADRVTKLRRTTPPLAKGKWRPEMSPEIMRLQLLGQEFVTRVLSVRPLVDAERDREPARRLPARAHPVRAGARARRMRALQRRLTFT